MLDACNRAEWDELLVRAGDVNAVQLFGVQPIHPFDLRDDFVTQAFHVEAIHKITADAGGKVGADLLHIETHRRNFVVIENDLRLRLIDLSVDVTKLKNVGLHRFQENLLGQLKDAFLARGRSDHETDWKIITARKRFRHDREHLNTRDRAQLLLHERQVILGRCLARAPGF